ncbi:hypothetical protein F3J20_24845 [Paraburkholderia sp. Cy-641]|uniref:hypothetical protein n=1 Tax=Paraburkholderia sp. Cy-641 TaxID=2608337 RepID=UPI0014205E9C|nr:hypothetical protein [Paraburkholderia sp. Cy-641]NIF80575.1 hypothetical protein [Paraburkholderia sp. Cy-641]
MTSSITRTLTSIPSAVGHDSNAEATPSRPAPIKTSSASPDARFLDLPSFQRRTDSQANRPTLATLPDDIYREISDHLPLQDVAALAQSRLRPFKALKPLNDAHLWANKAGSLDLDNLLQLMGTRGLSQSNMQQTSIAQLAPVRHEEVFNRTATPLLKLLNADPGKLQAQDLHDSIVTVGNMRPEEMRGVATGAVASLLSRVQPSKLQQTAFDQLEKLVGTYPPENRSPTLMSLSANIFKLPQPASPDSLQYAAGNLNKVLAHLEAIDDTQRGPILQTLIAQFPTFVLNHGDWKARFDATIAATRETSPQTQALVRSAFEGFLRTCEPLLAQREALPGHPRVFVTGDEYQDAQRLVSELNANAA